MLSAPLAAASEAPGGGIWFTPAAGHGELPRGTVERSPVLGTLAEVLTGPSHDPAGPMQHLRGAARRPWRWPGTARSASSTGRPCSSHLTARGRRPGLGGGRNRRGDGARGAGHKAAVVALFQRHRWLADAVGIAVIVIVALLFLSPALKDGFGFGPADLGASASYLTRGPATAPIHNHLIGDVIDQDVPWYTLDWRIVHHGSLPLWDSYTGTGLPQLFNFESAPLALPSLVGYLFPLSASFLITALCKLLIAGTGTYVLCRVLRTGAIGATLGGVSFMLSGGFAGFLGWAVGGPVAWSGFILAGAILAYRSRRRVPTCGCSPCRSPSPCTAASPKSTC